MRRFALLATLVIGCGSNAGAGGICPVDGIVRVNGQPADGASVFFHPIDSPTTPNAVGIVQADGKLVVTMYKPGDGLLPGKYNVTVSWRKRIGNSDRQGPEQLPAKYNELDPAKSGLPIVEATAGQTVILKLDLTK